MKEKNVPRDSSGPECGVLLWFERHGISRNSNRLGKTSHGGKMAPNNGSFLVVRKPGCDEY